MPPIASHGLFRTGGRVAADYETTVLSPLQAAYFADGPANLLLAQANRARLAVYPTLPTVFKGGGWLPDDAYAPGARGAALSADAGGWLWVSSRGPWLRRGRLLRRPRTLIVTGAGSGAYAAGAGPGIDAAWDAIDAGGWEAAAVPFGLASNGAHYFWGVPAFDAPPGAALDGDFDAAFGELCLCHLARSDDAILPFNSIAVGPFDEAPGRPDDTPDNAVYRWAAYQYAGDWYLATVRWDAPRIQSGPALWARAAAAYARLRLVFVVGSYSLGDPDPSDPAAGEGVRRIELLLGPAEAAAAFTGLPVTVLTVAAEPAATLAARAGAALGAWLADHLND